MTKQEKVVNAIFFIAFGLVAMGLIGNWTQELTHNTPKHSSHLIQYAQPCYAEICVR